MTCNASSATQVYCVFPFKQSIAFPSETTHNQLIDFRVEWNLKVHAIQENISSVLQILSNYKMYGSSKNFFFFLSENITDFYILIYFEYFSIIN